MKKQYRVYIDTNILIHGSEWKECDVIKEFIEEGKIIPFGSLDTKHEQEYKSDKHYLTESKELQENNSFTYDYFSHGKLMDEMAKQKQLKDKEKSELDYWEGCRIQNIINSYDLKVLLSFKEARYSEDMLVKISHNLQAELVNQYKISLKDSFHVMQCCRGEMDILLTNDNKFIKKCKKVSWIKFMIMSTNELINLLYQNNLKGEK